MVKLISFCDEKPLARPFYYDPFFPVGKIFYTQLMSGELNLNTVVGTCAMCIPTFVRLITRFMHIIGTRLQDF